MKVSGTIDNPKASMDVVSTVTSIVPGVAVLGKNVVTGTAETAGSAVKGTVGTLLKGITGK